MAKLYIAGDSFATLSKNQPIGSSWSELLAKELNFELINISKSGASNESICIQLDYIAECIEQNDKVVCFLTDSYRKTLPHSDKDLSTKHLLEFHSLHKNQNYTGDVKFQDECFIESYTHLNCRRSNNAKFYFKTFYNYTHQKWLDITLITGVLSKLKSVTDNFLIVSGGFDDAVYKDNEYIVTNNTFHIVDKNFLKLSSSTILKQSHERNSSNHISLLGHQKVFKILSKSIINLR